jgi:hypothetical protein
MVKEISDIVYRNINNYFIFTLLCADEQVEATSKRNTGQEVEGILEDIT